MADYQLRAFIESCLRAQRNFDFQLNEHQVRFLFGEATEASSGFEAELSCRADNWKAAVTFAIDQVIPPILDIISFHRHTTMLLGTPTRILKAEPGRDRRRAILINTKTEPRDYLLNGTIVSEINRLLAGSSFPRPVLRWLRNAYRPLPTRDRFVFAWLALETLAGPRTVTNRCTNCGSTMPSYQSGDRDAAYEIIRASGLGVTEPEFKRWWNELRNSVFHGGREPDSRLLAQLRTVSDVILRAVNACVIRVMGLNAQSRPEIPIAQEMVYYRHHFVEFDSIVIGLR